MVIKLNAKNLEFDIDELYAILRTVSNLRYIFKYWFKLALSDLQIVIYPLLPVPYIYSYDIII